MRYVLMLVLVLLSSNDRNLIPVDATNDEIECRMNPPGLRGWLREFRVLRGAYIIARILRKQLADRVDARGPRQQNVVTR